MVSYLKEFRKMQHVQESDEDSNSFESDSSEFIDVGAAIGNKRKRTFTEDDEMMRGIKRKPTRRPDPKVTNRNALMARENRRKQKENVTRLEIENQELSDKNCELQKLLKAKDKNIRETQREVMHLKSIIANRTQIYQILSSLQHAKLPMTSSLSNFSTTREKSPASESTSAASSGYESPNMNLTNNNGTVDDWLTDLGAPAIDNLLTFTDYEMDTNALNVDWDLGDSDAILSELTSAASEVKVEEDSSDMFGFGVTDKTDKIQNEHSYSENKDPGLCVHISNQRVSLEFCGRCHDSANEAWLEN